ncbi:MAG TPA: acyl-CoA dehydrogenase family protein [Anaerolineales bacterium]|nr:acyl-CoA dehydrogenase family protein [Anaerolineales bacterium]
MYSFEPTEEQKMLVDTVARYATSNLRPASHDADEENQLPINLIKKGWELGVLQASTPEAYGGFGEHTSVTGVLAAEEMAYGDLAGALSVMAPGLFAIPILLAGSEEQKIEYLPNIVEGDWTPYSAAIIEPHFDYDPNELKTTATVDGDHIVISGEKSYVPFAKEAKFILVYASVNGKTQAFVVPNGIEGLQVGERQKLLGIHALPVYPIKYEDVRIGIENRLGGVEGHKFEPILASMWLATAALAVGVSKGALEYAINYAKDRDVFGMKVAQKQSIAFMLAEMATEIEAIRVLTWEAAWMLDTGKEEAFKEAYLAYVGAADMAMMVTDRSVQILGGHGYIREHPVEKWMREGRSFSMLPGIAIL